MAPNPTVHFEKITQDKLRQSKIKVDTLVLTDLHLGAEFGRPKEALEILKSIEFRTLVLGGDTFQETKDLKLTQEDEEVISYIKNSLKAKKVVFVAGNHDDDLPLDKLKEKLGLDDILNFWQERDVLVLHGHQGDASPGEETLLKWVADTTDQAFRFVKLKHLYDALGNIVFQLPKKVRENAIKYGTEHKSAVVIAGHSHQFELTIVEGITYINTGGVASAYTGFATVDKDKVTVYQLV